MALSFADCETMITDSLPASALRHQTWWANERVGTPVQAQAWLDAGWKVEEVNLLAQRVTFVRASANE